MLCGHRCRRFDDHSLPVWPGATLAGLLVPGGAQQVSAVDSQTANQIQTSRLARRLAAEIELVQLRSLNTQRVLHSVHCTLNIVVDYSGFFERPRRKSLVVFGLKAFRNVLLVAKAFFGNGFGKAFVKRPFENFRSKSAGSHGTGMLYWHDVLAWCSLAFCGSHPLNGRFSVRNPNRKLV